MNKVTEFIEKNIEWLALGLGGLFLLWMIFAYVLTPPVAVKVDGDDVSLGQADRTILRGSANRLKSAMEQPGKPNLAFKDVAQSFATGIAGQNDPATPKLPASTIAFRGEGQVADENPIAPPPTAQVWVTKLATLPVPQQATKEATGGAKPTPIVAKGTSQVSVPVLEPAPAAGAAAPADPAGPPGPIQLDVRRVGNQEKIEDRLWVTLLYQIDTPALAKDLTDKDYYKVLNNQPVTAFLRVEVERQEMTGPDQWGDAQPVGRLAMNPLPVIPDGKDPRLAQPYIDWAVANTVYILKPPFYATLGGTIWQEPGYEPPAPDPALQPSQPGKMTLEEWRILKAQEDERKKSERQSRPARPERGSDGDRPSRRSRGENNAPRDSQRPASALQGEVRFNQVRRPYPPPPGYDPRMGEDGMDPGMMMDPSMGQPGQPGQIMQSGPAVIPQEVVGKFVPAPNTPAVEFWFHDETVQAGKTYRYRVRYKMLNPIYNLFNTAKPADLEQVFALQSDWSKWSEPVAMDALSQYYVTGGAPRPDSAAFDVYKWENGGWQQVRFDNIRPGDMVGGVKTVYGKEIDFTTGATIVDIRDSGPDRERIVILMDSQGNLVRRDFRTDNNDPAHKDLQKKAEEDRLKLQAQPGQPGAPPSPGRG